MSYMLYKEAENDDKRALIQALGAAGGGAAGYLMTRYGLGLKGAGAGSAGALGGAIIGAVGGNQLADYGKERNAISDAEAKAIELNKERANSKVPDNIWASVKDPATWLGAGTMGTAAHLKRGHKGGEKAVNKYVERVANQAAAVGSSKDAKALGKTFRGKLTDEMAGAVRDLLTRRTSSHAAREVINHAVADGKKIYTIPEALGLRSKGRVLSGLKHFGGASIFALLAATTGRQLVGKPHSQTFLRERGIK